MRAIFYGFFLSLVLAGPALAEPWIAAGQTRLSPYGRHINPVPNNTGALGEVFSLPYTVPAASQLCVTRMAIEGYDISGVAVMFLLAGEIPNINWNDTRAIETQINTIATATIAAKDGTHQMLVNYCWPEGTVVNVVLLNGTPGGYVHGWYVEGELTAAP